MAWDRSRLAIPRIRVDVVTATVASQIAPGLDKTLDELGSLHSGREISFCRISAEGT